MRSKRKHLRILPPNKLLDQRTIQTHLHSEIALTPAKLMTVNKPKVHQVTTTPRGTQGSVHHKDHPSGRACKPGARPVTPRSPLPLDSIRTGSSSPCYYNYNYERRDGIDGFSVWPIQLHTSPGARQECPAPATDSP